MCSPADSEGPSLQGRLIPKGSKQLSREHIFPRQTNQPRAHSPRLLHLLPPSGPPSTCPLHPGQVPYNQGWALCPGACGNHPDQSVLSCPPHLVQTFCRNLSEASGPRCSALCLLAVPGVAGCDAAWPKPPGYKYLPFFCLRVLPHLESFRLCETQP